MKQLIIIRHAKSSWETASKDRERPLSVRGIRDAHLISSNCYEFLPKSFVFWSSTAKRASETAIIFAQNLSCPEDSIIYKDVLYTFDEKQLEKAIKSCNDQFDNLIIFGHNPAITNFVNKFTDAAYDNIPTCGFVAINFEQTRWQEISNGEIQKVIFPKDLKNEHNV